MTNKKFEQELKTLSEFFSHYCQDKHKNQFNNIHILEYKNIKYEQNSNLCEECNFLMDYSFQRLMSCPHEIKPRCRKCPNPCYEKEQWKKVAKLMKYSGVKLGLVKLKNLFLQNFSNQK